MKDNQINEIMKILTEEVKKFELPIVTQIKLQSGRDAYKILISTMLSLRTKDTTTKEASARLFEKAPDIYALRNLKPEQIEKLIYPVGFYKTKALSLIDTAERIINEYGGNIPDEIDELLTLKGVGRKTANLVVAEAFDKDGICVDTHVHRISNRLGYVETKSPNETEFALRKKLPEPWRRVYNDTLVTFGQNVCRPVSPRCYECPITEFCANYTSINKK